MTINQAKVLLAAVIMLLSFNARADQWNQWGSNQQKPIVIQQNTIQPIQFAPLPQRNTESHSDTFLRQLNMGANGVTEAAKILDRMKDDE